MYRIRSWVALVALLLAGLASGCGSARDKGKNQDYDRPKATEKK